MAVEVQQPTTITVPTITDSVAVLEAARESAASLAAKGSSLVVVDAPTAAVASAFLADLAVIEKSVKAKRLDLTRPLDAEVSQLIAIEKEILAPIAEAKTTINERLTAYAAAEKAKAEEEARRLREIELAKARAEAEAQRAIAERERQARELAEAEAKALRDAEAAKAKAAAEEAARVAQKAAEAQANAKGEAAKEAARIAAEMAAKDAEIARLKAEEESRIRAQAEAEAKLAADNAAIEAQWAEEEAAENLAKVEAAPLEVIAPKIGGFHTQSRTEPKVTDLKALAAFVAESGTPLLVPDMVAIKAHIKLYKAPPPGVTLETKTTGVSR